MIGVAGDSSGRGGGRHLLDACVHPIRPNLGPSGGGGAGGDGVRPLPPHHRLELLQLQQTRISRRTSKLSDGG